MLPQLEQEAMYDKFDPNVPIWHSVKLEPREEHLSVSLCPSDPYSAKNYVVRDDTVTPMEQYAAASYAANWGPSDALVNLDDTPLQSRGVFYCNSDTRVRDIGVHDNVDFEMAEPLAGGSE